MIRRIARRLAGPNGPARLRRLSTAAAAVPTSLTVSVGSGASKQDVVEAVRKHMAACLTATRSVTGMDDGDNGNDNDALVLLASRDFAAWLDDRNLLAGLVAATETRRGDYTSVLGAARAGAAARSGRRHATPSLGGGRRGL
ncbi:hypothetical protein VTK73DRAFT_3987 [Phialemonium thermophilum]|uniref:Uncharacterized protein n=1 Tax=Phialemonium thermophilum TaxID=223376 RepID=A0ABR3VCV5_9PEZI